MKTVWLAPGTSMANTGLLALLGTRQFYVADLFKFDLVVGGSLFFCAGDADITWGGQTWKSGGMTGPYFDRSETKSKCHWKVGLEVDTLTFDVLPGTSSILGTSFLAAVRAGVFDGADMTLYRAFMPTYGDTSNGLIIAFAGRVAEVDAGRSLASFTVNSHIELLNQNLPRNLYQPGCMNVLGDAACGVNLASYSVTGTVTATSTNSTFSVGLTATGVVGCFDLGTITFAGGALNGSTFAVKNVVFGTPHIINLVAFSPVAPAIGDAFTLYYGCDKTPGFTSYSITGLTSAGVAGIGNPSNTAMIQPGMLVTGPGLQAGTTVTSVNAGAIWTSLPTVVGFTVATFTFTSPGGTVQNGCPKFNNLANFRGFPFVPQPASAA